MRYLLILLVTTFSLGFFSSCEREEAIIPSDNLQENTNFIAKAGATLHTLATAYEISKLNPEGIVALKSGAVLLPSAGGGMEMVGHDHSNILSIGKGSTRGKLATLGDIESTFSSDGSMQKIDRATTSNIANSKKLLIGVDGKLQSTENLVPQQIDLLNTGDFKFVGTGFGFDLSRGATFKMTPDANNRSGLVVVIEFKNERLRTIRSAFVVPDNGEVTISPRQVSFIPSGTDFTIRLIRINYELLNSNDDQIVFTAVEEVRGAFLALN